jgi:hypothetical protein
MQVNSAQDYLTRVKRQVIAKTYTAEPPFGKNKVASTYLSLKANNATQYQVNVAAACSGLGKTNTSHCCSQSGVLY